MRVTVKCPHQLPVIDPTLDEPATYDSCGEDLSITLYYDSSYGADADGNRGMPTYELEDIEQPNCTCNLTADDEDVILQFAISVAQEF